MSIHHNPPRQHRPKSKRSPVTSHRGVKSLGTAAVNKQLRQNIQPTTKLTAQQGGALQQLGSKVY